MLAHAATREGIVAVNNMFGKKDRIRYHAIPSVIYTHPEVASVGSTEEELKAAGIEYKKSVVPMAVAGRFLVENESGTGMVKVLPARVQRDPGRACHRRRLERIHRRRGRNGGNGNVHLRRERNRFPAPHRFRGPAGSHTRNSLGANRKCRSRSSSNRSRYSPGTLSICPTFR
jgi:hypothetical protein